MYPYQPFPQYQPPFQGQRQVLRANGKTSVDAIKLGPNESVLVMDTTAPLVWLCVADSLGNVSSSAYDISPHQEVPPVDMNSLEQRLANVENTIKKWEVKHESDVGSVDAKPIGRLDESDSAYKTSYEHGPFRE